MDFNLAAARASIIEQAINVEWIIAIIITHHYFKVTRRDFLVDVLYDESFNVGLKRKILLKIRPELAKHEQDIGRLMSIRNYFAHCGMVFTDPGGASGVPDPKKPRQKYINFEALSKEFATLETKVVGLLFETMKKMGVPLEPV